MGRVEGHEGEKEMGHLSWSFREREILASGESGHSKVRRAQVLFLVDVPTARGPGSMAVLYLSLRNQKDKLVLDVWKGQKPPLAQLHTQRRHL